MVKTKEQAKKDADNANVAKTQVKRKRMTSRPRPIPKKVMDAAKEEKGHQIYLEDSNHNRIYLIRSGNEPKARTLSLMFERNGEQVSETIPMNSAVMKLLNQARRMDKANSDFGEIINNLNIERVKNNVAFKVDINGNEDLGPVLKTPDEKAKEQLDVVKDIKLKLNPTIMVVPHIKKNGNPSKRKSDIQLMDADGKIFTLTKDMYKQARKQDANSEFADKSWKSFVKDAKEGKIKPETVASFFNGQANLGATNAKAAEQVKGVDITPDMTIKAPEKISLNVQNNGQNNNVETYLNTITNPGIVGRDNVAEKDKPKAVQNDAKPKEQEKVTTGGVVAVAKENGEVEVHKYNASTVQNDAKPKEQEKVTTGGVVAVAEEENVVTPQTAGKPIETGNPEAYAGLPKNEQGAPVYVEEKPANVEETTIDNKKQADRIQELRGLAPQSNGNTVSGNDEKIKVGNRTYTVHKEGEKPLSISTTYKGITYTVTEKELKGWTDTYGRPITMENQVDALKNGLTFSVESHMVDGNGQKMPKRSMKDDSQSLGSELDNMTKGWNFNFNGFGKDR